MPPKFKTLPAITVATAGTPVQVSATVLVVSSVMLTADSLNSGKIYVGDSDVSSSRGQELAPGDVLIIDAEEQAGRGCALIDLSEIYVDTAVNGNVLRVAFLGRR